MSEENISQVDDKCCLDDANPMKISEETSLVTMPVIKEEIQGDNDLLPDAMPNEINHVDVRRYSTGGLDKRGPGKALVQTRYRGNQLSSTHDVCKHGKRREDDLVIKPWKLVKKKNVEGGDLGKGETLGVTRKSLGNVSKPEKPLQVAKKDGVSEIVKSCDDLSVKNSETKSTTTPCDSAAVRKVKKKTLDVNKVSRITENKSSKEDLLKNLKNKEKMKADEMVRSEDVLEKTFYVVDSNTEGEEKKKKKKSIKSVKSEIQQSPEKKILRGSGKKSLNLLPSLSPSSEEVKKSPVTRSDPRPIRQTTSRSKIGLSEKKVIGSANLVTASQTESKIRPKRIVLKVTPPPPRTAKQVSFKKGKVLVPKPEDTTLTLIKFKKRVVQEPKNRSDGNKKKNNLKDRKEAVGKMNSESKREKVVLRHRKVEAKKKLQTLFNNVIEETVNKLEEVRKSKVKALVGAFETVISLQDNDISSQKKKIQSKSTSSQVVEG